MQDWKKNADIFILGELYKLNNVAQIIDLLNTFKSFAADQHSLNTFKLQHMMALFGLRVEPRCREKTEFRYL